MNHRKALSRTFPAYHPRAGQATNFVEKVWMATADIYSPSFKSIKELNAGKEELAWDFVTSIDKDTPFYPKSHTIRAGHKVKVGDTITFFVWLGKPYDSKQMVIVPPITVKKVWNFEIADGDRQDIWLNRDLIHNSDEQLFHDEQLNLTIQKIAHNDGLDIDNFIAWFKYPKPFSGQIICWNDKIKY